MKKLFTLLFVFMAALNANAEEITFDFANNNGNWPVGIGANLKDGNLTAPLTMGEGDAQVTLTGIDGTTQVCCIMQNNNKAIYLKIPSGGGLKLNAANGRALTRVEVTMLNNTFDLTPSTGALAENVWTGNASEVTFSHNNTGLRNISKIVVTTAAENDETIKPAAPEYDVEAANIAAFNAAEDGKVVKLTLTNAKVNGYCDLWANNYIEDASGAVIVKGITLTAGTELNGYIIGKKRTEETTNAIEYILTATDATTFEATATTLVGTVMTGAEAAAQANYGKLITLENVSISGNGKNKTLKDAEGNTLAIKASDYMAVLPSGYTWPEKASSFTGILVDYYGWILLPISADAIVAAGAQPTEVIFDFASENFREGVGTKLTDPAGYIIDETFTSENVKLQITAGSAPSRIYKDATNGIRLAMYKEYATLTFTAPEGYAITKIELNDKQSITYNFMVSGGTFADKVWTGNAEGVRFTNNGTPYLINAIVTLAAKNESTVAFPAIQYTECANIAAFNALEAGAYAKVTLTDAEVIGKSADGSTTVWIQDATGGCWIQYTSLNDKLNEKTKINGTVYVVKRPNSGVSSQMKESEDTPNSVIEIADIADYTMIDNATAEQLTVRATSPYINRVVKISGASFEATSKTAGVLTLSDGITKIDVTNGTATGNAQLHKLDDFTVGDKMTNVTIVAILVPNSSTSKPTENMLLPISMTSTSSGIRNIDAANVKDVQIYNLQGVRMNSLQRGLNIVNGKKVVIK